MTVLRCGVIRVKRKDGCMFPTKSNPTDQAHLSCFPSFFPPFHQQGADQGLSRPFGLRLGGDFFSHFQSARTNRGQVSAFTNLGVTGEHSMCRAPPSTRPHRGHHPRGLVANMVHRPLLRGTLPPCPLPSPPTLHRNNHPWVKT